MSVLLGNGDGTFQPHFDLPAGSDPYDVKVADLTGDGMPDIIVTNKNDNTVGVFLGEGKGTFEPMKTYPVASGPYEVVVADLTGNGIPTWSSATSARPWWTCSWATATARSSPRANSRSARGPTGWRWPI